MYNQTNRAGHWRVSLPCNAEGISESSYKNDILLYNTEGLFTLRCESICNDTDTLPPRKVTF